MLPKIKSKNNKAKIKFKLLNLSFFILIFRYKKNNIIICHYFYHTLIERTTTYISIKLTVFKRRNSYKFFEHNDKMARIEETDKLGNLLDFRSGVG